MPTGLTYEDSGVRYKDVDPFKGDAGRSARLTALHLTRFGFQEVEESRGETTYLIETPWGFLAHTEESLGTKNLAADNVYASGGNPDDCYGNLAIDTVAMIVNDMAASGASPLSVEMHFAVGNGSWFDDRQRYSALIKGWLRACHMARCSWGGGETPILPGVVNPETFVINGSAVGIITPKERRIRGNIRRGDAIILLASSGIHANGLTLARKVATLAANGYKAKISPTQTYGEALLVPTTIYVPIVEALLDRGVVIHYISPITGHGWRKLMRNEGAFVYVIERIPKPQKVFLFIQSVGMISNSEMYGTLNMGAGYAIYAPEAEISTIVEIAAELGIYAFCAGFVDTRNGEKKVLIRPLNLEYDSSTLGIR